MTRPAGTVGSPAGSTAGIPAQVRLPLLEGSAVAAGAPGLNWRKILEGVFFPRWSHSFLMSELDGIGMVRFSGAMRSALGLGFPFTSPQNLTVQPPSFSD